MKNAIAFLVILLGVIFSGVVTAVEAPISIDGIYPDSGPAGTSIILKGHGFALGNTQLVWAANLRKDSAPGFVEFNGARGEIKLWQDNLIMVIVPTNATSGPVRLTLTSGIAVTGNHFEVTNPEGPDQPKRDYSFQEKEGVTPMDELMFNRGLYPSPYFYYYGHHPRYVPRRMWNISGGWNRDGFLDFFLVSGPLLASCNLFTGLDSVVVFPAGFGNDFRSRMGWWQNNLYPDRKGHSPGPKRKYHFQE